MHLLSEFERVSFLSQSQVLSTNYIKSKFLGEGYVNLNFDWEKSERIMVQSSLKGLSVCP